MPALIAPSPITAIALPGLPVQLVGNGKAEARRNRGGAVRRAERVIFAFAALGEAGQAAALPQGADPVAPAGDDLVRIGLVADIPDQPVFGRVEDIVDRHGQFDHAKARTQMPAGGADGSRSSRRAVHRPAGAAARVRAGADRREVLTVSSSGVAGRLVMRTVLYTARRALSMDQGVTAQPRNRRKARAVRPPGGPARSPLPARPRAGRWSAGRHRDGWPGRNHRRSGRCNRGGSRGGC